MKVIHVFPLQTLLPVEGVRNTVSMLSTSLNRLGVDSSLVGVKVLSSKDCVNKADKKSEWLGSEKEDEIEIITFKDLISHGLRETVGNSDIIHIHSANPLFNTLISSLIRLYGNKDNILIATLYSTKFLNPFLTADVPLMKKIFIMFSRDIRIVRSMSMIADLLIVHSKKGRSSLYNAGIKNVIYFPHILIDRELLDDHCNQTDEYFSNYDHVLFFAGDLATYRGVEYALILMAHLKRLFRSKKILLIVPNKGSFYVKNADRERFITYLVKKYKLEENVKFIGIIPRRELGCFLSKSDVVLMPYTDKYAIMDIPLFLAEAMSAGGITVGTKVGAVSEIIEDRVSGFLVEPGHLKEMINIVSEILYDVDKYAYVRLNAKRKACALFSSDSIVNNMLRIYNNLSTLRRT